MILLFVALAAIYLASRSGGAGTSANLTISPIPTPPPSKPLAPPRVIHQSTGASLSQALGNASRSPGFYSTGNPGTGGQTSLPSSTITFVKPKWSSPPITPTISNPFHSGGKVTQNAPGPVVKTTEQTAVGVKRVSSALVNPRQALRPVIKPEQPGAFWTKRMS
jgi:hypothetical protein